MKFSIRRLLILMVYVSIVLTLQQKIQVKLFPEEIGQPFSFWFSMFVAAVIPFLLVSGCTVVWEMLGHVEKKLFGGNKKED